MDLKVRVRMSPLFFGRAKLPDLASQFTLTSYVPQLSLQGLGRRR